MGREPHPAWRPRTLPRLLGWIVLAGLLPGLVQIRTGRRRTGWAVLLGWLLLVLGGAGALAYLVVTGRLVTAAALTVQPDVLRFARAAAVTLAVLWGLLLVHAFLLLRPFHRPLGQRVVAVAGVLAIAAAAAVPAVLVARTAGIQADLVQSMFRDGADRNSLSARTRAERPDGRLNVLLLGGDAGPNRDGTRTDSMQVASVDRRTGKAVLVALPRNLQRAPFPPGSPMAERFPRGFDDLLNAVYPYGEAHPELFPGALDPGAEAITQAVSEITGLPIDYHVLVNLAGFEDVIDAIGGITIRVEERVPIGGKTGPSGQVLAYPSDWIEPGLHHLNGRNALWYARGRFGSDDYQRMRRQRCVMGALLGQADPRQVLVNYQRIADSTRNLVETNIPQSALPELVEIALDARGQRVVGVTLTRSVIDTADPDFLALRRLIAEQIERSMWDPTAPAGGGPIPTPAVSTPTPTDPAAPTPTDPATPTATPSDEPGSRDVTGDISTVCRYN